MATETERPDPTSRARAVARALVAVLVVATFAERFGSMPTPISGVRPTQSAMIAANLDRDLSELGPRAILYPRIDYAGEAPGYLLLELPLVNLAGVGFQRAFGLPPGTAYRLPSLVAFALMALLLFELVQRRFGAEEAVVAVLLASSFPTVVKHSVQVMPEQGATTAFLAGLYLFDRHLDRGRLRWLAAATACFAAMLLVKSTTGVLLLVPAGLARVRGGSWRTLFRLRYVVAAAVAAAPLVAWSVHAAAVNRTSFLDDGYRVSDVVEGYLAQRGRWPLLVSSETYGNLGRSLAAAFGLLALALGALGIARGLARGPWRALFACWLASLALFFVALPFHVSTHWYYTHGYAPLVALGGALVLGPLVRRAAGLLPAGAGGPAKAIVAAGALALVLHAHWGFVPYFNPADQRFGRALRSVVPSRSLGIISSRDMELWDGLYFHASNTRGWRRNFLSPGDARWLRSLAELEADTAKRSKKFLQTVSERRASFEPSPRQLTEEFVEEKRALGATFLAHFGSPEELASLLPDVWGRLTARYPVLARSTNWIVFDLR